MSQLGLKDQRILIIDQDNKVSNDRTWCFWSEGDHPFQDIVHHSWPKMSFVDDRGAVRSDMGNYQYHLIRGIDFYQKVKALLKQQPNVHFLTDKVENVYQTEADTTVVWTTNKGFTADLVLNSIFRRPAETHAVHQYNLQQHFMGWWIETDQPQFDPGEARLMDFSIEQQGDCRFMYILPVSATKALVEFTLFSEKILTREAYEKVLEDYIRQQLKIEHYKIYEKEKGRIPMTNQNLSRFEGEHIIPIGTAAGWVKPSTGYAFLNIQKKSQALAESLVTGNRPAQVSPRNRYQFYDNLLLHILTNWGSLGKRIFSALFRNNPTHRILTFLNERSTLKEEVLIFGSLPYAPFLRALWQRTFRNFNKTEKPFFSIPEERVRSLQVDGNSEKVF